MAPSLEPTPLFRVVVAGSAGMFQPADGLDEGHDVQTGQIVGQIITRQGSVEVAAHAAGVLTEWLAHYDDPVAPGQPVARIGGLQ
jgi:[acyl-carrier-protein] S-malonyltransferase